MVPLLVVAPSNTLWFFRFNSQRSEKDSVWVLAGKVLGATVVSNQLINAASLVEVAVALGYGARGSGIRPGELDPWAVAPSGRPWPVMVWMMVNKVWNPQYVLWVFAAGAVVSAPRPRVVRPSGRDGGLRLVVRVRGAGPRPHRAQLVARVPLDHGPAGRRRAAGGVDHRPAPEPGGRSGPGGRARAHGVKAGPPREATVSAARDRAESPSTTSNHK